MRRVTLLLVLALAAVTGIGLQAQDVAKKDAPARSLYEDAVHCTMTFQGHEREYYVYIPETLLPGRPLVFMLHGYGGHAYGYREEMLQTALKHGFAVCVPQGYGVEGKCKPGWNVRYPVQKVMKTDDVAFILALRGKVLAEFNLNEQNCFFSGMSNGGEMCYIMAYRHPEKWNAIASVAGLRMKWLAKEKCRGKVPFMEIHGTSDKTSRWKGDYTNKGGWGAYTSVPSAVRAITDANGCVWDRTYILPLKDSAKPSRQVILHKWGSVDGYDVPYGSAGTTENQTPTTGTTDRSEVRLYEVIGGKHSWHLADIDTTEEIWSFFSNYLR